VGAFLCLEEFVGGGGVGGSVEFACGFGGSFEAGGVEVGEVGGGVGGGGGGVGVSWVAFAEHVWMLFENWVWIWIFETWL